MKITYDSDADTRYIYLRDGDVDDTLEVNQYIYADVDDQGVPLGIEIIYAKRVLGDTDLSSVTFETPRAVLE